MVRCRQALSGGHDAGPTGWTDGQGRLGSHQWFNTCDACTCLQVIASHVPCYKSLCALSQVGGASSMLSQLTGNDTMFPISPDDLATSVSHA
jgi:hypothetical protein